MSDTASTKITRLDELPRDIPPPHDGWPALEARLLLPNGTTATGDDLSGSPQIADRATAGRRPTVVGRSTSWRSAPRRSAVWFGAVAAAVAAIAAGILVDRLILQAGHADTGRQLTARQSAARGGELAASFVTDPRYLAERRALLASLDERLKSLPPQTRRQVLASLATIHQSMQQIQQALGREPTNALLQGLLIDTYQDEMRVLTAVQEAGTASGES